MIVSLYDLRQSSCHKLTFRAELGSRSISSHGTRTRTIPIIVSPNIGPPFYVVHAPVGRGHTRGVRCLILVEGWMVCLLIWS